MKKIIALVMSVVLALGMCTALTGCGDKATSSDKAETKAGKALSDIKIGLICLHDENSTYDNNFIQAMKTAQKNLGLSDDQVLIKTNIPEDDKCYSAAAELAESGCDIVFADSFGHESYIIQAATEFEDVQFCHATGTKALTEGLDNYHNAFASIYEGRFLAGVAAGMKLNEMIESGKITEDQAVIGYIGAFPYAEVKSGYTSFFLGARYICKSATMKVTYTNSWFDIALEREAALKLIKNGCVLISQHADSEGAPKACEEKNVPNVAYNISTISIAPNTALISSKINWAPYYEMIVKKIVSGEAIPQDYCGSLKTGDVELTALNESVAAKGTADKIDELKQKLIDGELQVFDTDTFTVNGKKLESCKADVITDANYTPDTEVVENGAYQESTKRSAPYFDQLIDGITEQ